MKSIMVILRRDYFSKTRRGTEVILPAILCIFAPKLDILHSTIDI